MKIGTIGVLEDMEMELVGFEHGTGNFVVQNQAGAVIIVKPERFHVKEGFPMGSLVNLGRDCTLKVVGKTSEECLILSNGHQQLIIHRNYCSPANNSREVWVSIYQKNISVSSTSYNFPIVVDIKDTPCKILNKIQAYCQMTKGYIVLTQGNKVSFDEKTFTLLGDSWLRTA